MLALTAEYDNHAGRLFVIARARRESAAITQCVSEIFRAKRLNAKRTNLYQDGERWRASVLCLSCFEGVKLLLCYEMVTGYFKS